MLPTVFRRKKVNFDNFFAGWPHWNPYITEPVHSFIANRCNRILFQILGCALVYLSLCTWWSGEYKRWFQFYDILILLFFFCFCFRSPNLERIWIVCSNATTKYNVFQRTEYVKNKQEHVRFKPKIIWFLHPRWRERREFSALITERNSSAPMQS